MFTKQPRNKKINVVLLALLWNAILFPISALVNQSEESYVKETQVSSSSGASSSGSSTTSVDTSEISQSKVMQTVKDWLSCKNQLFQKPYDKTCGLKVLTGKAYSNNIRRTDGQQSSIEWLESNNSYYTFSNQSVNEVKTIQKINSQEATADVVVTEQRVLYSANGNIDQNSSGYDQRLVRYSLKLEDGSWKISDYDTVEVLWERQLTNQNVAKTEPAQRSSTPNPVSQERNCLKKWSNEEHLQQALAFYRMNYNVNASSAIRHAEAKSIARNMLDNAGFCSDLISSQDWSLIRDIVRTENGL
ncbi:DUF4101 domain-containing protein [Synechococcus moorigangaii CMS01]|nr:DUF4101 domain-containing protein [Synechococcus moorigangaii CMS01]